MKTTTAMRSNRRPNEVRSREMRERILGAAITCIRTMGYTNATISEIAQTAKASPGALQHHFRSRNDLMLAVLDESFGKVHDFLSTGAIAEDDLRARVDKIVEEYWRGFGSRDYLVAWEIIVAENANPDLRGAVLKHSEDATNAAFTSWRVVFGDLHLSDERLYSILTFTLSTLRGLSFLQFLRADSFDYSDQTRILKENLFAQLERR